VQVKVLGTGCRKCDKLYLVAERAIAESGVQAELHKVEEVEAIMAHGVAFTPALVVDDQVLSTGRLPRRAQIVSWLVEAARSRT